MRRIDLGGKFMTNYLKELVSFRCAACGGHGRTCTGLVMAAARAAPSAG